MKLAVALTVLLAAAAHAQPTPKLSEEDRQFLDRVNRPVLLTLPGMDAVRIEKDVVYQKRGGQQKADVYLPPKGTPSGVVLFIHGGMGREFPVRPKDWGLYRSYGRLVAASGLAAVVFNHRAGFPKVELPAATEDLRDAIRFARERARAWGTAGERICLAAFSGGGPLLALAMREPAPYLRCQIGVYPILDIGGMDLFKSQMSAEDLISYSPVEQIAKTPALPLLIVRAGHDAIPGLLVGLDRFVRVALEKNAALTLVNHPEAEHGFDNKLDAPRTREILRQMLAFLHEHLD